MERLNETLKKQMLGQLYDYIDQNCLFRCNPQVKYNDCCAVGRIPGAFPSAQNSYQFFLRRLTHDAKMLTFVSALFFDDLFSKIESGEESSTIQLCGLETSSIPLMIGLQSYAARFNININSFSVRKSRKTYGLFNFVDGMPTDAPVVIVDDIINSGKSIGRCIDCSQYELGLRPANNSYCIIKFNPDMDFVQYKQHKIAVTSLFAADDFNPNYDKNKYWLPKDCDKFENKRPDYF